MKGNFHGTEAKLIDSINSQGFDRSFTGISSNVTQDPVINCDAMCWDVQSNQGPMVLLCPSSCYSHVRQGHPLRSGPRLFSQLLCKIWWKWAQTHVPGQGSGRRLHTGETPGPPGPGNSSCWMEQVSTHMLIDSHSWRSFCCRPATEVWAFAPWCEVIFIIP